MIVSVMYFSKKRFLAQSHDMKMLIYELRLSHSGFLRSSCLIHLYPHYVVEFRADFQLFFIFGT